MNGRMYSVNFDGTAVTVAADLFEIAPADDKACVVHAIFIGQSTELGDAAEEQLRVRLIRGHTTSGSGGSANTPTPLNPSDTAAGFAAETCNTTAASAGTGVFLHSDTFNVRTGWMYIPTPEARPIVTQVQGTLVLRLSAAPTDSVAFSGTMIVEELG